MIKEEINHLENYGDSKAPLDKIFADVSDLLSEFFVAHPHTFSTPLLDDRQKSLDMLTRIKNEVEQNLNSLKTKEKEGANGVKVFKYSQRSLPSF